MSIRVWSRAWPTCRFPVTFGGGSTIENGRFAPLSTVCSSALKYPAANHRWYSGTSTAAGSYWVASSWRGGAEFSAVAVTGQV